MTGIRNTFWQEWSALQTLLFVFVFLSCCCSFVCFFVYFVLFTQKKSCPFYTPLYPPPPPPPPSTDTTATSRNARVTWSPHTTRPFMTSGSSSSGLPTSAPSARTLVEGAERATWSSSLMRSTWSSMFSTRKGHFKDLGAMTWLTWVPCLYRSFVQAKAACYLFVLLGTVMCETILLPWSL